MTSTLYAAPGVLRRLCPMTQAKMHSACFDASHKAYPFWPSAWRIFEARLLASLAQAGC